MLFKKWGKRNRVIRDELPESVCVMPWVHFHVAQNGLVTPCCQSPWKDEDALGDINKQSIEEIWNNSEIRDLRKKMLQGKKDSRCARCFEKEKDGWLSLREISNNDYLNKTDILKITDTDGSVNDLPVYFDIRFSNACNLKCRICGPWASSQWHSDAIAVGLKDKNTPAMTNSLNASQLFFDDFENYIDSMQQVYFAGGEPLFMQEHYTILDLLLERNRSDVKLTYNTNLSKLTYKGTSVLEYWSQFSHVNIAASIDAIGKKGELLRKNMNWDEVRQNIKLITSLPNKVEFMISPTVYAMNVYSLPSFHKEMVKDGMIGVEDFIPTLLVDPAYYNVQILPLEDKDKLKAIYIDHIKWIKSLDAKNQIKFNHCVKQFENIITYLFAKDRSNLLPQFIAKTAELDGLRDEKFLEIFPELAHLFKL